jgi:molybdopterin-guanine dinucleotide biosynthesis protein A
MGKDKALVQLQGRTLLERALGAARAITPEVMIVGERSKFASYGPVVEDVFRQRGPLGGIHSALAVSATELNLILAVDLPFIEPRFLKYLCHRAQATDAVVTLPRAAGGWQPLCAVYRKEFATLAEQALRLGQNKIDSLFADIRVRAIEEQEITSAGFSMDMFGNVNTPQDIKAAIRQGIS